MEILIVMGLLFGGLTAIVASGKGYEAPLWFFIGLIGGLFGLIAIALMPTKEKAQE